MGGGAGGSVGEKLDSMDASELRIPIEWAEHLVHQLQNAAKATGSESLMRDAEVLESLMEKQARPYPRPPG
jgi:hypothetical protein